MRDEHGISNLADAVDEAMERIIARIEEGPPEGEAAGRDVARTDGEATEEDEPCDAP